MDIIERIEACQTGQELVDLAASQGIELNLAECEEYVEMLKQGNIAPEIFGKGYCEPLYFQSQRMR